MITTATDWLAPEARALHDAFGPTIDLPDSVALQAIPNRHNGIWHTTWRLRLTAERVEAQHRKPNRTVTRAVMVAADPVRGGYRANDDRFATVQEIIDQLAAWAAEGVNTLELLGGVA